MINGENSYPQRTQGCMEHLINVKQNLKYNSNEINKSGDGTICAEENTNMNIANSYSLNECAFQDVTQNLSIQSSLPC